MATWTVTGGALLVFVGYGAFRFLLRRNVSWIVAAAAALASLGIPTHLTVEKANGAPNGLLAVAGSFALLILGTIVALARARHSGCRPDTSGTAK